MNNRANSGWAATALGGLVVWQIAYLFLTNFWGLFPPIPAEVDRYELGDEVVDATGTRPSLAGRTLLAASMDHWGELTGLWQGYAFFAPNVPTESNFLALELRWHGAEDSSAADATATRRVKLLSPHEPACTRRFFKPALASMRTYNYEWRLSGLVGVFHHADGDPHVDAETLAAERDLFADLFRREWKQYRALIEARIRQQLAEEQTTDRPDEVVVSGRTYRPTMNSRDPWLPVEERPLLRYRGRPRDAEVDAALFELFDPVERRFVPIDLPKGAAA